MTPRDKAKELMDKFKNLDNPNIRNEWYAHDYKNCALICVDEILNNFGMRCGHDEVFNCDNKAIFYYQKVKQEIINL